MDRQLVDCMRPKAILACSIVLVAFLCWTVLFPSHVGRRSLNIRVKIINPTHQNPQIYFAVSNISKNVVFYDLGRSVDIAFFSNGVWVTNDIGHFFIEEALLTPAFDENITNLTAIPVGTTAIKAGISYVSLTWRGLLAYKNLPGRWLKPTVDFLHSLDESTRSETEWSQIYFLNDSTNRSGVSPHY